MKKSDDIKEIKVGKRPIKSLDREVYPYFCFATYIDDIGDDVNVVFFGKTKQALEKLEKHLKF